MGTDSDSVLTPSRTARALAAILMEVADSLDTDDLRAADAITDVRRACRTLAESVFARGWGELFLGLEVGEQGEEAGEEDALFDGEDDFFEETEGLILPPGTRVTYQARFDYVITDPAAFMRYLVGRRPPGDAEPPAPPQDEIEALGTLAYLDGLGSRDYSHVGLEFAGGREVVRPLDATLWEMSHEQQDDHYPFE